MKTLALVGILLCFLSTARAFNWPVAVEIEDDQKEIFVSVVFSDPAKEQFGYKSVSKVSIDEAAALLSKLGGGLDTFSIGILADPRSDSRRYRPILQTILDNVGTRVVSIDDGRSSLMYRKMMEQHVDAQNDGKSKEQ